MTVGGSSSHIAQAGHSSAAQNRKFLIDLARAFAGALIFALPMLMTMEMWWIGFYIAEERLIVLALVLIPLLIGLSYFSGFRETTRFTDDVVDAFVAIAAAAVMAALILTIFGVIRFDMPAREVIGKIVLQTFPGSIGAMLAQDQMSGEKRRSMGQKDRRKNHPSYAGELFLMAAGALFLGLNVAPTEEMILLSYRMQPAGQIALAILSLVLMHAFVYAVDFQSAPERPQAGFWSLFMRFTVAGYAVVLLISLYLLWTFGRTDGATIEGILSVSIVLGFPCAIGAAAARIIL
ncbi:TIGR02587 family membrane protein [Microvirga roseola]|uniref:TIGR02587 family membrane protein n=1 Tax=Microvirga roseola TaxID=2883126 RepID=UPI001E3F6407|nr:TIGR02587 family membrane protein [Microvirga roseola]